MLQSAEALYNVCTLRHLYELIVCSFVPPILVWVPLFTQLSVLPFNVLLRGLTVDTKDFVVVDVAEDQGEERSPEKQVQKMAQHSETD
jgi:hypothetical protein